MGVRRSCGDGSGGGRQAESCCAAAAAGRRCGGCRVYSGHSPCSSAFTLSNTHKWPRSCYSQVKRCACRDCITGRVRRAAGRVTSTAALVGLSFDHSCSCLPVMSCVVTLASLATRQPGPHNSTPKRTQQQQRDARPLRQHGSDTTTSASTPRGGAAQPIWTCMSPTGLMRHNTCQLLMPALLVA
jgi:hypothetical protein